MKLMKHFYIGEKIDVVRHTDNSDIHKKLTVKMSGHDSIEFNELKGVYKIYRARFNDNVYFHKGNIIYNYSRLYHR